MNKHFLLIFTLLFSLGLQAQSLIGINVDNLSDAQVLSIFERGKAQGLTIENGQEMAINNGMSEAEALKFKSRLEGLIKPGIIEFQNQIIEPSNYRMEVELPNLENPQKIDSSNIFGHDYFNVELESFDKMNGAKAPSNYILGSADELTISIYGNSYFQQTFRVSELGILNLGPKFGRLKIRGMQFKNVEKLLRARFARNFDLSKNTFDLSLSYGRNISINIVGEVKRPGTYSLTALNNAFHALVAAGGPTEIGSLRNVKIYRSGDVVENIDFYKFFINPEGFKITFLQDGDFLIVPAVMELVSTSGSFQREMNFEILPDETLQDLIDLSGGFSMNSYDKKIKIFRNQDKEKIIVDVESKDFSSVNLSDGDSIYADFKDGDLDKYVNISGAFAQPGNYGYTDGMTLDELINIAGGVTGRFPDKELILSRLQKNGSYKIFRIPFDNKISSFKLQISDYVSLSSREQDLDEQNVKIMGAVNNPGNYKYSAGMTLDDIVKISGGILERADNQRIEITRRKVEVNKSGSLELVLSSMYVSIDSSMTGSWDLEYDKSNIFLQPYDIINVREVKNYRSENSVYISGEVQFPGDYPILKADERISDLILRSGGISKTGDAFNSRTYRQNDSNLVFRLDLALSQDQYNYMLQPNDSIHVPKKSDLVFIKGKGQKRYDYMGEFYLSVPFNEGNNAREIINSYALGFSNNADKRNLSVSYPNGKHDRTKRFLFFNIYPKLNPGGTINISKKQVKNKVKKDKKPLDWNQLVATVTSAAMGFGTVYAIINRP
jgi:protein involved in polysaccharide export with SLBB domain